MQNLRMPIVTGEPMAITEPGLNDIIQLDFEAVVKKNQAILARPGKDIPGANITTIRDRVAIVEMIGPIFHYENIFTMVYGYPSCEQILQDIKVAQENPAVDKIVLHIDSPGGQVGGLYDVTAYIKENIKKPVVAYVGDLCASAAYWIASAADNIFAAETAEIGSIGVVLSARRRSDNQIEIVSSVSPKKRPDPATDEGRAVLQARADALAEVFVSQVATNRGLTTGHIEATEGNVFIAQKALDMGFIDGIGNLEDIVSGHFAKAEARPKVPKAGFMELVNAKLKQDGGKKSEAMGAIAADNPHLHKAWLMEQQGSQAKAKYETPAPSTRGTADFMALVVKYQTAHGCKKSEAMGAIAAENPGAHHAWLMAQQR